MKDESDNEREREEKKNQTKKQKQNENTETKDNRCMKLLTHQQMRGTHRCFVRGSTLGRCGDGGVGAGG